MKREREREAAEMFPVFLNPLNQKPYGEQNPFISGPADYDVSASVRTAVGEKSKEAGNRMSPQFAGLEGFIREEEGGRQGSYFFSSRLLIAWTTASSSASIKRDGQSGWNERPRSRCDAEDRQTCSGYSQISLPDREIRRYREKNFVFYSVLQIRETQG